jgi:hypothetical protein
MKFTMESMKMVEPSLSKLLKEDLPIRMSYRLSKFYEVLIKEMEKVESLRHQLVRRYGEEIDNTIKVTEENLPEFNKEYNDLLQEEVDAGDFEPIPVIQILSFSERLESMGKQSINISAYDIQQLKSTGLLIEGE